MTPNFPSRLRVAIRSAGISQKMLADRAGCSSAAISRYLSGRDAPGEKMMQRLADALDTSVDQLTHGAATWSPARPIKVDDAARCMGVSVGFVRRGMQRGELDIGNAIKCQKRWGYFISPPKLLALVGEARFMFYFGGDNNGKQ